MTIKHSMIEQISMFAPVSNMPIPLSLREAVDIIMTTRLQVSDSINEQVYAAFGEEM